jgi:hypothetical protein
MQEARGSSPLSSTVFRARVRGKATNVSHLNQAAPKAMRLMSVQEAGTRGCPPPRGSRPTRHSPVTSTIDYAASDQVGRSRTQPDMRWRAWFAITRCPATPPDELGMPQTQKSGFKSYLGDCSFRLFRSWK